MSGYNEYPSRDAKRHRKTRQSARKCLNWVVCHERRLSTAARNCMRDEGGPFRDRQSGSCLKPRKLLPSKAMVVSGSDTPDMIRQARLREASASEPSMTCRKRIRCHGRLGPPGGMNRAHPRSASPIGRKRASQAASVKRSRGGCSADSRACHSFPGPTRRCPVGVISVGALRRWRTVYVCICLNSRQPRANARTSAKCQEPAW